ncbi:MAG: aminotransferase class I/II-fold pyridoxal phosphate-dependent enzyme [Candidatus Aminicenantes bacterium]|nr:aminotransferase class I/II-fold pyridoxal phosphate-dependent enzyme [Candidatus Aminicenantes bacterium]
MIIKPFEMERWQSQWEHKVDYNLSESGVHPFTLEEMMDFDDMKDLLNTTLGYIQTDGTPELKSLITKNYSDIDEDNVLVTTGSSEANLLSLWSLVDPGMETVFMLPNFMQIHGLMDSFGAQMKTFYLKEELNWQPELKELKKSVTKQTGIISITNPNNPTGSQLDETSRKTILDLAQWSGAWLICDEVYQGAELNGKLTPTFWGEYDKTIISCGLSKSYGLSGLRVGWVIAPKTTIENLWKYKDYTTISISALSDRLARIALEPKNRKKIFQRTQNIIRKNYDVFRWWINDLDGIFECVAPKAGAICFPGYHLDISASQLAKKALKEKSVLLQPGDQMKVDRHIRIGLGEKSAKFKKALALLREMISELS